MMPVDGTSDRPPGLGTPGLGTPGTGTPGFGTFREKFVRAATRLSEAAGIVAGLAIVAMMIVLCIEVFCRYVLVSPTSWANEVTSYLLVAATAFGAPYTLSVHGHIAIDVFVEKAPARIRAFSYRFGVIVVTFFSAVLLWYGTLEVLRAAKLGEISLTPLAMPTYIPFSLIPICALLLIIQALAALVGPLPRRNDELTH